MICGSRDQEDPIPCSNYPVYETYQDNSRKDSGFIEEEFTENSQRKFSAQLKVDVMPKELASYLTLRNNTSVGETKKIPKPTRGGGEGGGGGGWRRKRRRGVGGKLPLSEYVSMTDLSKKCSRWSGAMNIRKDSAYNNFPIPSSKSSEVWETLETDFGGYVLFNGDEQPDSMKDDLKNHSACKNNLYDFPSSKTCQVDSTTRAKNSRRLGSTSSTKVTNMTNLYESVPFSPPPTSKLNTKSLASPLGGHFYAYQEYLPQTGDQGGTPYDTIDPRSPTGPLHTLAPRVTGASSIRHSPIQEEANEEDAGYTSFEGTL